jgi:hypothetical protein
MPHRAYREAEARLRESLALRGEGFWRHTYPGRKRDLETMRLYHAEHGIPPSGFVRRLWWSMKRGEDRR